MLFLEVNKYSIIYMAQVKGVSKLNLLFNLLQNVQIDELIDLCSL